MPDTKNDLKQRYFSVGVLRQKTVPEGMHLVGGEGLIPTMSINNRDGCISGRSGHCVIQFRCVLVLICINLQFILIYRISLQIYLLSFTILLE